MTINRKTAQLLERVAAVFRVREGESFRYKAYQNAASVIENLPDDIREVWKEGKLQTIPGVGEKLQRYLGEYFKKKSVRHFDSLFKKVPAGMFALMNIRGVGPVTAYRLAKKFQLKDEKTAITGLRRILQSGQIYDLDRFKEKSVTRLKKSLVTASTTKTSRTPLFDALTTAEAYLAFLRSSKDIIEAEPLGSLRRRLPTIGDIDIGVCTKNPSKAMSHALSYDKISGITTKGNKVSHVRLSNGFEVDIKISKPANWGSMLQHYTGSKMHNIKLRTLALKKGMSLSEYGIKKKGRIYRFGSEEMFYKFLGLKYIPPELREDQGEIELYEEGRDLNLLNLSDIKGDLHIHSNHSFPSSHDIGTSSLSDILNEAKRLGYEYIGISDHNPKITALSDKQKIKIIDQKIKYLKDGYIKYEKSVKNNPIKLLIGLEIDILHDGRLSVTDAVLSRLDYAIVSIHSSFDNSSEDNTDRIISALSHPKALIFGHPTGRIINTRPEMKINWTKLLHFMKERGKILEINAYPSRLDPPEEIIRQASEIGVKFVINTDSHSVSQMKYLRFGVWQARRGFLTSKQVINCLRLKDLRAVLK